VALKFVNGNSYGGNADAVSGIWKEAETLKTLDHPNIVKILNTIPLKELSMVMIMEYYEGGELGDIL
jgi:serine/threonine protein kinase